MNNTPSQFAVVNTKVRVGLHALEIIVEAHLMNGLPNFIIIGLPDNIVKESKERVRSALINSGFIFPIRRILINLSPAEIPKANSHFDLPIALAILIATGQLSTFNISKYDFVGELSLGGQLNAIKDCLLLASASTQQNRNIIVPAVNINELEYLEKGKVFAGNNLQEVYNYLQGNCDLLVCGSEYSRERDHDFKQKTIMIAEHEKRALTLAAAGFHHVMAFGEPNDSTNNLAQLLLELLPPLTTEEQLTLAIIQSINETQILPKRTLKVLPTSINVNTMLVGQKLTPGELSLANYGVLLLPQVYNFHTNVLHALLNTINLREINVFSHGKQLTFPAQFSLVVTMLPCACGYLWSNSPCLCSVEKIKRHYAKANLQLQERIDLHLYITQEQKQQQLTFLEDIHKNINELWNLQKKRNKGKLNGVLSLDEAESCCVFSKETLKEFHSTIQKLNLSVTTKHRIRLLARTIADIDKSEFINHDHLLEALYYRPRHLEQLQKGSVKFL